MNEIGYSVGNTVFDTKVCFVLQILITCTQTYNNVEALLLTHTGGKSSGKSHNCHLKKSSKLSTCKNIQETFPFSLVINIKESMKPSQRVNLIFAAPLP